MSTRQHAMFFHAHPDDESSKGAGTMAKLISEGHRVSVVTCTDGSAGEILNPHLEDPATLLANLRAVRKGEIANALQVLGVTEHYDLDFKDSGWLPDYTRDKRGDLAPDCFVNQPMERILGIVVPIIRTTRPEVVITYDENGGYPHPDHIHTHDVSMLAMAKAADPTFMPGIGTPWEVRRVYYHMHYSMPRLQALVAACKEAGITTHLEGRLLEGTGPREEEIGAKIDVQFQLEQAAGALKAHATQVDPEGHWFTIPLSLVANVYPYEEYLRAVPPHVPGEAPDTTLFSPHAEPASADV